MLKKAAPYQWDTCGIVDFEQVQDIFSVRKSGTLGVNSCGKKRSQDEEYQQWTLKVAHRPMKSFYFKVKSVENQNEDWSWLGIRLSKKKLEIMDQKPFEIAFSVSTKTEGMDVRTKKDGWALDVEAKGSIFMFVLIYIHLYEVRSIWKWSLNRFIV